MLGTLFNVFTVVVGSAIGLVIKNKLPARIIQVVFQALGLFTMILGVSMTLKTNGQHLIMIFSLIIGSIIGEVFRLDENFNKLSEQLKAKLKSKSEKFSEGFITAFILFCIGPMAILGSIQEGLGESSELLFTKSVMDGFSSIALAAALGIGVLFSAIPLFLFQGGITLSASFLGTYLSPEIIAELTALGGVLLVGLGINILEIKKIKILNMLPSLVVVVVMCLIFL